MVREVKRLNMNIPVELLERVDEYADSMTISRTAAVLVLINMGLDNRRAMNDLSELLKLAKNEGLMQ